MVYIKAELIQELSQMIKNINIVVYSSTQVSKYRDTVVFSGIVIIVSVLDQVSRLIL